MLDYRPNIYQKDKRITNKITDIKILEDTDEVSSDILNKFYNKIEFNSTSNIMNKTTNLKDINTGVNNESLTKEEIEVFDDVLDYKTQNDRLISITDELKEIEETLSIMMYGEVLSQEQAKEKDESLFKKLKETEMVNNENLINLSKMLIIINEYVNTIEKHVEEISFVNAEISNFTSNDKRKLILTDEEINSIQKDDKTNLENSLYVTNYVSDKSIVNNHMINLYNSIIDYNLCAQAINKLNNDNNINRSLIYEKGLSIKDNLINLIKTVEYSSIQSERYLKNLRIRFDSIKDLYIYEERVLND